LINTKQAFNSAVIEGSKWLKSLLYSTTWLWNCRWRPCANLYQKRWWPNGEDYVGVGIKPHIFVERTVDDITTGIDRTFDIAVSHLQSKLASQ